MPLIDVAVGSAGPAAAAGGEALPEAVQRLIADGQRRGAAFLRERPHVAPGFVPSDFEEVYRCFESIVAGNHAPGPVLCEWGSGTGVVACLGAMLGLRAHGIEIERDLVRGARELARDHGVSVQFACGSFIPPGMVLLEPQEDFYWLAEGGSSGYEELELQPDELDVVFAYPWPGEEHTILRLFEHAAATGALLVTYHGRDGMRVQRKTDRRRRPARRRR